MGVDVSNKSMREYLSDKAQYQYQTENLFLKYGVRIMLLLV